MSSVRGLAFGTALPLLLLLLLHGGLALQPVGVIGSTGKLGRKAIERLSAAGIRVRALSRHGIHDAGEPSAAAGATSEAVTAWLATLPGATLVKGDVTDAASVTELLRGCSACLALHGARRSTKPTDLLPWVDETIEPTHSKRVNYDGVQNIIDAMRSTGCRRVVRVTGKGETPWSIFSILINGLGSMAKARALRPLPIAPQSPRRHPQPSDLMGRGRVDVARAGVELRGREPAARRQGRCGVHDRPAGGDGADRLRRAVEPRAR